MEKKLSPLQLFRKDNVQARWAFVAGEPKSLTAARERFSFEPIGGTDAVLPVCSGDMLFNVFDEYPGFLR